MISPWLIARRAGVVFDVIQCLIQRDFSYATQDVRNAYQEVKKALGSPTIEKVVFIIHSQGGIEGSMILDMLFADVPGKLIKKLEVYTFGNAANHFNNPEHAPDIFSRSSTSGSSEQPDRRAIRHIEHYANRHDFVSRWGVLSFASARGRSNNRYCGRVFEQNRRGHQLNQHYLDTIFPLNEKSGYGLADENLFMESEVQVAEDVETGIRSRNANGSAFSKPLSSPDQKVM